ncbi:MAG: peptidylprolyl isomerase, partial [Candidatus Cloacimonetes bacterium]|nr:peptidylprolyl isomerase [Candidatus Cloacimonadota bacterium]
MERYNRRIMLITGAVIIFILALFYWKGLADKLPVLAKVNDREITTLDFRTFVSQTERKLSDNEKKLALDYLVAQEVINIYAEKTGVVEKFLKEDFDKELEYYRRNLMIEELYARTVEEQAKVSTKEAEAFHKQHPYMALFIIGKSRINEQAQEMMNKAHKLLREGISYRKVMKMYCDPELRTGGGLLGYFLPDELPPPYDLHMPQLTHSGKYSEVFETDYGYIIVFRGVDPPYKTISPLVRA